MMRQAVGLIEAVGLAAAIEAADTAIKSANVTLLGYEMTRGDGMITVKLAGDVGAVKAAVTAGVMAGNRVNEIYSYHIIPRPHEEIAPLIARVDRGPGQGGPPADEVPIGSDGDDGGDPAPAPEAPEEKEADELAGADPGATSEAEEEAEDEAESAVAAEVAPPAPASMAETPPVAPLEASAEAAATEERRCEAITQAGTRCRNRAQPGLDYCHIHAE